MTTHEQLLELINTLEQVGQTPESISIGPDEYQQWLDELGLDHWPIKYAKDDVPYAYRLPIFRVPYSCLRVNVRSDKEHSAK
jgi:hypothetical protein